VRGLVFVAACSSAAPVVSPAKAVTVAVDAATPDAGDHPLLAAPDMWHCVRDECFRSLAACEAAAEGMACLERSRAACLVGVGDGEVIHAATFAACFLELDLCRAAAALLETVGQVTHPCTDIGVK
jgi:hypothetical protein